MKGNLRMNYIYLSISIFMSFYVGFMYLLLGKSMVLPLKIGYYVVLALAIFALIIFNIFTIIKTWNIKKTK